MYKHLTINGSSDLLLFSLLMFMVHTEDITNQRSRSSSPKRTYYVTVLVVIENCFNPLPTSNYHKPIRIYMGGLILGANTLYMLFCF